jgi:hypothetical protein
MDVSEAVRSTDRHRDLNQNHAVKTDSTPSDKLLLIIIIFPLCCQFWMDKLSEFYLPATRPRLLPLQILVTFTETIY